jgi:hypothetical protein
VFVLAVSMRALLLSCTVFVAATFAAAIRVDVAQTSHSRTYVANSCGYEAVEPLGMPLDCPGADEPDVAARRIAYRTYGRRVAVATATFKVCGGACYDGATPAEEMSRYYKAPFGSRTSHAALPRRGMPRAAGCSTR